MNWLFSLLGLQRNTLDDASVEQYRGHRALGRQLNLALIKQLPATAVPECGKKLGLYKSGTLILNQDDELALVYDYCLHHHRRAGKNVLERKLEHQPPVEDSTEAAYFQAMSHAHFSVFRIDSILPHRGAKLTDLLRQETLELMDIGLSSAGVPGIIVVGRVLAFDDFKMSSGILIPVPESVYVSKLEPVMRKFMEGKKSSDNPLFAPAQSAAFESQILRIALHAAGEDNTFYTDIEPA